MSAPIIVIDIEATSDHRVNAGIVEIGAINLITGAIFEVKLKPHGNRAPDQSKALEINGCDWLEDSTVPSELEAMRSFAAWLDAQKGPAVARPGWDRLLMAGHNCGQYDYPNLEAAFRRCSLAWPFAIGVLDMHSLACQQAWLRSRSIPMKSREIYQMLGLPEEPAPHRALCGATLEACALMRLLPGFPDCLPNFIAPLAARFFPNGELKPYP